MNSNVKLHLRTPHLLMVLFPQISWSGLKSPPGWALLISKASKRCSRNPQKQAGSREGNTREPCESLHHHRVVSTTSQNQVRTGSAQTKPVLAWQGETWPSHTGLWWQEGDKGTPNTEWLQQIYCCSLAADTSTGLCELQKSSPCLSVCPSIPPSGLLTPVCRHGFVNQCTAGSQFSTKHPDFHFQPTLRHSITQILSFPQGVQISLFCH